MVDVTDKKRDVIHEKIMKVSIVGYIYYKDINVLLLLHHTAHQRAWGKEIWEKLIKLHKSMIWFVDGYLKFLHNEEEDISSLFCSKLVS